jgi:hypothetical protein
VSADQNVKRPGRASKFAAAASGAVVAFAAIPASPASAYDWEYPGGMNSTEFNYCLPPSRWNICNQARVAMDEAFSWTQTIYGHRNDGTKANAFQHSYWLARMTQRMSNNTATSMGFGDRHEANTSGNPKAMDLHNNAIGANTGAATDENGARFYLKLGADDAFLWAGYPNPAPADKLWYMVK